MKKLILIVLGLLAALVLVNSLYTVNQTERAIQLRFGAVSKPDIPPGLHWKIPFAEKVVIMDGRVLTLDSNPERYFTLEKKPLIVDSFAKWRVKDVQKYYTASSGDERRASGLLAERVSEGLRNQISRRDMHEVISGEREQMMLELTQQLNEVMLKEFGVAVIDIRVKKIDLPQEVSNAVYDRMTSERQIEARQHRATGRELALGIRADAERQTVVIAAEAYRKAQEARGEGDAQATAIYADAYNRDADFYEFYRSINAYTQVFRDKSDLLVLDPNSEFFQYLKSKGE